jgi:hypothetical protein
VDRLASQECHRCRRAIKGGATLHDT